MIPKPNILWIVTTQWRAQAVGYAGDPNLIGRTPHLDAFARTAGTINFTQAVTPHPFGPFARAALLTGIPSPENGVRDYFDPLPNNARTIAHDLREYHGYSTAFFGKWHLAKRDPRAALVGEVHARMIVPPESRGGFDFWEGFESGFLLNDPFLHGSRLSVPQAFRGYQSDVLCERALEYLHASPADVAKKDSPWFCIVSLEAPHPPYAAQAGNIAPRNSEEIVLPKNIPLGGELEMQARRELAGYYAHIEATDAAIGKLIRRVRAKEKENEPNTLIVFTSVHGDMHGAHGLLRKGWPYEESVRVPLLVNHPSLVRESNNATLSLLDLHELTMSFAAEPASRPDRNAGCRTALQKAHAIISMPSVVRLPHQCDRSWCGVRMPMRKLILNDDGSPWLFFDLENDPLEMCNLADDPARADEIAAMRALIEK